MSMYHLVFGDTSPKLGIAKLLGVDPDMIPRYRDLWIEVTEPVSETELVLAIYTRTGGGNREEYEGENDALAALPHYLGDDDDEFDSTYATFRFLVTRERIDQTWLEPSAVADVEEVWAVLRERALPPQDPSEKWRQAINAITNGAAGA